MTMIAKLIDHNEFIDATETFFLRLLLRNFLFLQFFILFKEKKFERIKVDSEEISLF